MRLHDLAFALKKSLSAAKHAFKAELSTAKKLAYIRNSKFFDAQWYLKNNPDVAAAKMDPAVHYLIYGVKSHRNPSPFFVNDEYYALHNDVRTAKMNPLLHYERFGKREGRPISLLEVVPATFSEGCIEGEWRFNRAPRRHGRTAVVASYFGKGTIPETLIYLLRGLREVVDNIVYVADCPVLPEEVEKLRELVTIAKFVRHCQYDFGSYRRGLEIARAEGLLEKEVAEELVVINDSNYGPVYPFAESFGVMAERDCDFWGYTGYNAFGSNNEFVQSFFFLFRRKALDSGAVDAYLQQVDGPIDRDKVIAKLEWNFSKFLTSKGLKMSTFVPMNIKGIGSPTKNPLTLCGKYRMPLLKVKAVNGDSYEDVRKVLRLVRHVNPELSALIKPCPIKRTHKLISYDDHQSTFPGKCAAIAAKMQGGAKAKAVFFVSTASMFPARPLFEAMTGTKDFDPYICVIPDLRWHDKSPIPAMEACEQEMLAAFPSERVLIVRPDEFGIWPDVLEDADLACYPSPYELSAFRYNPHYSIGRQFLPICVNYGFYRSKYDRIIMSGQSYAYMWKAFFECKDTVEEYKEYSATKGSNVDLVGYIKMDALAKAIEERTGESTSLPKRKTILVAPHHSVEGGTNKELSLANFVRYADFFLQLPDRYPEIDFIFRPHPFLFKVMSRKNQWGPVRVEEYITALKSKPNVIWSDGGDYFKEFAASDACIQDCGSYLVEYFYTKKPCCYMLKSPDDIEQKFAPLGKKCLENCYVAYDTNAIEDFIRDVVVSGNDPMKAQREKFADSIMVNYPHAANVALEHIKRDINSALADTPMCCP